MCTTSGSPQLRKALCSHHLAQCVWCVNRTIDDDVGNMHTLACPFSIQSLAQHAPPTHSRCMRVLTLVSPNCRARRGHQDSATSSALHEGTQSFRQAKQCEYCHLPTQLELLQTCFRKRSVTNLCSQVEHHNSNGTNLTLNLCHQRLDGIWLHNVELDSCCSAWPTCPLDITHEASQPFFITATHQHGVVAFMCKPLGCVPTYASPSTEDEAHRFSGAHRLQ
mmetsp:Transcript_11716/g.27294  ORF Transcript_11716/g.27294 Transcript_11716/m.27294 type:complete len:222 (+) Transcript_11716:56-721(+)